MKYTIDDRGLDWFRDEVESRSGTRLQESHPFRFVANGDAYGWQKSDDGQWHYTLFVQNGRVLDSEGHALMSGLRAIASSHVGEFRFTPNQNLIVSNVSEANKATIDQLLADHGIANDAQATPLRLHSLACVALPTCGLAMAESERYLPSLIDRLDAELETAGLGHEAITIRMTGCPNGCARPYVAEIGLVGKGPGRYNLYLGAGFAGDRLGSLFLENADESEIVTALRKLFGRYAKERQLDERFGDFLVRAAIVRNVREGSGFHGGRVDD